MKGQLTFTTDTTFALSENARQRLHADCFFLSEEDAVGKLHIPGLSESETALIAHRISTHKWKAELGSVLTFDEPSMMVVGIGKEAENGPLVLRHAVAELVRSATVAHVASITIFLFEKWLDDPIAAGRSVAIGYHLGNYSFEQYKSEKHKTEHVKQLNAMIIGQVEQDHMAAFEQGCRVGELQSAGVYLARDLVNQPGGMMGTEALVEVAREIADSSNGSISLGVYDQAQCAKMGMGAFLGVAKGSVQEPRFIVLEYKPSQLVKKTPTFCLIGKSVTFDTGGLSLKPAGAMEDMKIDMAGGAAVLGAFKSLALFSNDDMEVGAHIYGILPACENMPSGHAMRPGDVVAALDGQTIEVLNTDAEGRLTLADALAYAQKHIKPNYIIDLATLTGACMVALGSEVAGVWGNNEKFMQVFEEGAVAEGDMCWRMPLRREYRTQLTSHVADIANIANTKYGGAITAALFLNDFVDEKMPWIHVDMAGPAYRDDRARGVLTRGATGWGVLSLLSLVMEEALEKK